MPMSKGAKIAVGCPVGFVGFLLAVCVAVFGVAWWGFGKAKEGLAKIEQTTKEMDRAQKATDALKRQADAIPFAAPGDGVIAEERLVKFLNVRKKVYTVYESHKAEL